MSGRRGLLTLLAATLMGACTTIDCPVQTTVQTNYSIVGTDGQSLTLYDTLYVWTPRADGTDTLLLNRGINITQFAVPVSYQHPEDTLIFYIADTLHHTTLDTVWLKKNDIPHFESVDCNTHYFHRLTAVRSTHEAIDTITISNPNVNYDTTKKHLNIRFKARQ